MGIIKYLYRQSKKLFLTAVFTSVISGVSGALFIAVLNAGINQTAPIKILAVGFLFLCLMQLVFRILSEMAILRLTQEIVYNLRLGLSRKLLRTSQKKLQAMGEDRLLVILTQDIETVSVGSQNLAMLIVNALIVVACFSYLIWLWWQMFVILTAALLIGTLVYALAERIPLKYLEHVRTQTDRVYENIRQLIKGSRELQLNKKHGVRFIDEFLTRGIAELKHNVMRSGAGYIVVGSAGNLLFFIAIGIVVFIVPHWMPRPVSVLSAVALTLLYLIDPIALVMNSLPAIRRTGIALERIALLEHDLDETTAVNARVGRATPFAVSDRLKLELKGVCHQYPGKTEDHSFMLGPIDISIHQGEIVFIIGGNGSGKTTLAMLLLGLYEPEQGVIVLNNETVTEKNREDYRQHFSAIFSDFHLFEYLLESDKTSLQETATDYLKLLHMDHKVKVENGRFSSVKLSTGQRKRLALVAAYLEDRPIYLFDEWASDQDPEFKKVFYTTLLPALKAAGKTVLAITHDDAYFSYADRVIKLEDGHLKEFHQTAEVL